MQTTVSALIESHDGDALAFGSPNADWMTYADLRALSTEVRDALHGFGVGRGDRVAIVLPNGPEMAAAFITIAQVAVTAPLNPASRIRVPSAVRTRDNPMWCAVGAYPSV